MAPDADPGVIDAEHARTGTVTTGNANVTIAQGVTGGASRCLSIQYFGAERFRCRLEVGHEGDHATTLGWDENGLGWAS